MRKDLKLFKIVYDFLKQLTDEQLKLLVSDKAKLQLEITEKNLPPVNQFRCKCQSLSKKSVQN